MSVFVLDRRGKPPMPCSEKLARLLSGRGRARVAPRYPFTIRLIDRTVEESVMQPVRIKIDPGSRTTGFKGETVVLAIAELAHRGAHIRVGEVQALSAWRRPILSIEATGRGAYQRTRLDRFGFPRGHLMRTKRIARSDGYGYALTRELLPSPGLKPGLSRSLI